MGIHGVTVHSGPPVSGEQQGVMESKNTPSVWGRIVRVIAPIMAIGGIITACLTSGAWVIPGAVVALVGVAASAYFAYQALGVRSVSTTSSVTPAKPVPASLVKTTGEADIYDNSAHNDIEPATTITSTSRPIYQHNAPETHRFKTQAKYCQSHPEASAPGGFETGTTEPLLVNSINSHSYESPHDPARLSLLAEDAPKAHDFVVLDPDFTSEKPETAFTLPSAAPHDPIPAGTGKASDNVIKVINSHSQQCK